MWFSANNNLSSRSIGCILLAMWVTFWNVTSAFYEHPFWLYFFWLLEMKDVHTHLQVLFPFHWASIVESQGHWVSIIESQSHWASIVESHMHKLDGFYRRLEITWWCDSSSRKHATPVRSVIKPSYSPLHWLWVCCLWEFVIQFGFLFYLLFVIFNLFASIFYECVIWVLFFC